MKDIKEIKGIKDKLDLKEQKARIKKLEKEAAEGEHNTTAQAITVTIEGGADEYAK